MRRFFNLVLFLLFTTVGMADGEWMGIYLQGQKIGYASHRREPEGDGAKVESHEVIDGRLLGADLKIDSSSTTWLDATGRPTRMVSRLVSGGRSQEVEATFSQTQVTAKATTDGRSSEVTLPIDPEVPLSFDALEPVRSLGAGAVGKTQVFDPATMTLQVVTIVIGGEQDVEVGGKSTKARVVKIEDPRAPMDVYLSSKGDFIKAIGPFGMELRPETMEVAMSGIGGDVDIAVASSIRLEAPIDDYDKTTKLVLRVTGFDLGKLPSDAHQTVEKDGDGWRLTIHPAAHGKGDALEGEAAAWLGRDVHVPAGDPAFLERAAEAVGDAASPTEAAERIRQAVFQRTRTNAGIGVLRDANDVWETAEGVCRDHAVLMATLLRSRGIPSRLVSGLVYADQAFYYHAWVEAAPEGRWVALDSTRPGRTIDATHIKVRQGTVGQAFTSFLMDGARFEVLEVTRAKEE